MRLKTGVGVVTTWLNTPSQSTLFTLQVTVLNIFRNMVLICSSVLGFCVFWSSGGDLCGFGPHFSFLFSGHCSFPSHYVQSQAPHSFYTICECDFIDDTSIGLL